MKKKLKQGIDLFSPGILIGKKVAVITNHTAVDHDGVSLIQKLRESGVNVSLIFSLEHGYFPVAQDMESVGKENKLFDIPVVSLYGENYESLRPDPSLFNKFDTVVYDLQDIGSRYYTYIQSLSLFMDYLEEYHRHLVVLDRVNPINGVSVEGAMLEYPYRSFVGLFPLLQRHGMTTGEIVQYYYGMKNYTFSLDIISVEGWKRDTFYDEYDYPWIPTSPNMPTVDTAILYPGGCLLEGTNLSEGRGTTFPFHVIGKSGIDSFTLKEKIDAAAIPGLTVLPMEFRPMFQKEKMKQCGGVYLSIKDRTVIRPMRAYLRIIQIVRELIGDDGFFREKPYEFIKDVPAIELLLGKKILIDMFYRNADFSEIDELLTAEEQSFLRKREPFLLYEE